MLEKFQDITVCQVLQNIASGPRQKRPAMRKKFKGIWNQISYAQYYAEVLEVANGLFELGLTSQDKVVLFGDNSPEMVIFQLAVQCLGGITFTVNFLLPNWEIAALVDLSDAKLIFAANQECVDKALEYRSNLGKVLKLIYNKEKGSSIYFDNKWLISYRSLRKPVDVACKLQLEAQIAKGKPEDICLFAIGEGSSGQRDIAMYSHQQLVAAAFDLTAREEFREDFDYFSLVTLANIFEQVMAVYVPMVSGMVCHFPESVETTFSDLQEIAPQVLTATPEIWGQLWDRVNVGVLKSYKILQAFYFIFLQYIINEVAEFRIRNVWLPPVHRFKYYYLKYLLFKPLRRSIGLRRTQRAYCYNNFAGFDLFANYQMLDVTLRSTFTNHLFAVPIFMPTSRDPNPRYFSLPVDPLKLGRNQLAKYFVEHCYLTASSYPFENNPNIMKWSPIKKKQYPHFLTVGKAGPQMEVRLSKDARLEVKSPYLCKGIYKEDYALSKNRVDEWYQTGETGFFTGNQEFVYIDKHMNIISDKIGNFFSVRNIEFLLNQNPFISGTYFYIDKNGYHNILICFNHKVLKIWLMERGYAYSTYTEMSQHKRASTHLRRLIRDFNARIPNIELHIHRFAVAPELFFNDSGELTLSGKTRRPAIEEMYRDLLKVFDEMPAPELSAGDLAKTIPVYHSHLPPDQQLINYDVVFVSMQGKQH